MTTATQDIASLVFTDNEKRNAALHFTSVETLRARAIQALEDASNPLMLLSPLLEFHNQLAVNIVIANLSPAKEHPIPPPVTNFTGTPLSGLSPVSVSFTDSSTNSPTSWHWEKNDGSGWIDFAGTPAIQNPTESLTGATWSIRLTTTNVDGSDDETKMGYIVISTATVPVAPTIGAVTVGDTSVTVAFTDNGTGGSAITGHTAISTPGSHTGTGASPITVSGLTDGVAYTFTVHATNAVGNSVESSPSGSATPVPPGTLPAMSLNSSVPSISVVLNNLFNGPYAATPPNLSLDSSVPSISDVLNNLLVGPYTAAPPNLSLDSAVPAESVATA